MRSYCLRLAGDTRHASDRENFGDEGWRKNERVRGGGEWVGTRIECFFLKLVDGVKVVPEGRSGDLAKSIG